MSNSLWPVLRLICPILAAAVFTPPASRAQATFRGLGSDTAFAFDISAIGGSVVGYGRVGLTSARQAFRWNRADGYSDLGGNSPWYRSTVATCVSGDGTVIGGQDGDQAFRWTEAGGRVLMGIPRGSTQSAATDISANGAVLVGSGYTAATDHGEAFRWSAEGLRRLGALPGTDSSFATGVSGDGAVVVGYSGTDQLEAFRWTADDGMIGLGAIAGASQTYSLAQAISTDGQTIVGTSASPTGYEAFRWTEGGGMASLDPAGKEVSAATDVTGNGDLVVGNWLRGDGVDEAFVWTAHSGIRSLVDVLTRDLGLGRNLAGWSSVGAYAVSSDGRYIAGSGYRGSEQQAWLLDRGAVPRPILPPDLSPVPEPSTYGWLAAVLTATAIWSRSRHLSRRISGRSAQSNAWRELLRR